MGRESITDLFERLKDIRDFKTGNGYDLDDVEVALIADEIKRLRHALKKISSCGQSAEPDHWEFRKMAREVASAALTDMEPKL